MSEVWQHFKKEKDRASCKHCAKTVGCKGSSTSALINHIKNVHQLKVSTKGKQINENNYEPPKKKTLSSEENISNFFTPLETIGSILARCAAEDGMSVRAIQRSNVVRNYIRSKGFKMPSSAATIWKEIYAFYTEKVSDLTKHLASIKREHGRFSITVDEWSDISNYKYINVSLRTFNVKTKSHEIYNLGLEEIKCKATAENVKKYVEKQLNKFSLNLRQDIVASTHDGAPVMKKYGYDIEAISQLCLNHAIHLCVVECLYTKRCSQLEEFMEIGDESDCGSNIGSESSVGDYEDTQIVTESEMTCIIEEVLKRLRKCVNMFSKSNEKQKKLQEYVQKQEGKELRLSIDVKHRWNSMSQMVTKFLKIYKCVNHALMDFGLKTFSDEDILSLERLNNVLNPLELAVKELSKDSATLIDAEGIFKFLLNKLSEINSHYAIQLCDSLKIKFSERRSEEISTLIIYLSSGNFPAQSNFSNYSSKPQTKLLAERIYNRLFVEVETQESDLNVSSDSSIELISSSSLLDELNKTIQAIQNPLNKQQKKSSKNILFEDFSYLDKFKKRTDNLDKLYYALLTISPTSTISERVFSICSFIKNKNKNRLKPKNLDCILFLKDYFKKQT